MSGCKERACRERRQLRGNPGCGGSGRDGRIYNQSGADELVFYDITASVEGRKIFTDILTEAAKRVFIPLTVGGGISTLDDFDRVLKCGADKVSVNSGAIKNPELITEAAHRYGDQCVVLSMDVKRVETNTTYLSRAGVSIQALMRWNGQNPASDAAQASWWSTVSIRTV